MKTTRNYQILIIIAKNLKQKNMTIASATEEAEQQELSYTADENSNQYRHFAKQFGSFL